MENLFLQIYAILICLFVFGFFAFMLALGYSPRFRTRYRAWKRKYSPRIQSFINTTAQIFADLFELIHDSFITPILLVFSSAFIFEEIYEIYRASESMADFWESLIWSSYMNPFPYYIFLAVVMLWFFGFMIQRAKTDEDKKQAEREKADLYSRISELSENLANLILEIRQDRDERKNNNSE